MISAATLFLLLVDNYNLPPTQAAVMTCIAYEESRFDTTAINHSNRNGTKDYGLYQINSIWVSECGTLMDMHHNIKCAIMIYEKQGIKAWVTHKRCTQ